MRRRLRFQRHERSQKWEDRRRLEREGDEILELLGKHEKKEAEEEREKKAEERWTKCEDRQRLERQGDEIMETVRRHERGRRGKEAAGGRDVGRG